MLTKPIEDHSGEEILDVVESIHRELIEGNSTIFRCALEFANIHNGDAVSTIGRVIPGTERSIRLGGPGTPRVMEFAAAELGARMQMGTFSAKRLIADAQDVCHRLPRLWARVCAGEVKVSYARFVAQQTRQLAKDAAAFVDARVAEYADGRLTWSRFEDVVAAAVIEADPEAAAAREAEAAAQQFAKATRSSEHGMKAFYLRSTTAVIVRFEATVAYLADALRALGDTDTEDLRRVKACLLMANPTHAVDLLQAFAAHRAKPTGDTCQSPVGTGCGSSSGSTDPTDHPDGSEEMSPIGESDVHPAENDADDADPAAEPCSACGGIAGPSGDPAPFTKQFLTPFHPHHLPPADPARTFRFDWSKLLPSVTLYLHLSQDTIIRDRGGVARWEGESPVSAQYVRDHLAPYHRFTIKPVIDCANQAPVDAHEIPDRHREAVHLRTPADTFPYSSNTSRAMDIDHTLAYLPLEQDGPPGQSNMGNYGPAGRFHHRIKTHGDWELRQPFPGIYIWRDPHGHYFIVDHTGTRKITKPRRHHRQGDRTIEIFPGRQPIEYDATHAA